MLGEKMSSVEKIQMHCDCGICGHFMEQECIEKECRCCLNFHLRSGPGVGRNVSSLV